MNEILSAVPVVISLIIIEGLLSVDNAMAIAAMASGLPENQRKKALRYGIVGAYVMRGICLAAAAWIASNLWVKALGAAYLVYLAATHLAGSGGENGEARANLKSFWRTVVAIEIMDLSLSLDNVVAAVALDSRLWVVIAGVFIGILILRFVAGTCIALIEKFPTLNTTAFLLVGFVGLLLFFELCSGWRIHALIKFAGIVAITGASLLFSKPTLQEAQ